MLLTTDATHAWICWNVKLLENWKNRKISFPSFSGNSNNSLLKANPWRLYVENVGEKLQKKRMAPFEWRLARIWPGRPNAGAFTTFYKEANVIITSRIFMMSFVRKIQPPLFVCCIVVQNEQLEVFFKTSRFGASMLYRRRLPGVINKTLISKCWRFFDILFTRMPKKTLMWVLSRSFLALLS